MLNSRCKESSLASSNLKVMYPFGTSSSVYAQKGTMGACPCFETADPVHRHYGRMSILHSPVWVRGWPGCCSTPQVGLLNTPTYLSACTTAARHLVWTVACLDHKSISPIKVPSWCIEHVTKLAPLHKLSFAGTYAAYPH